MKAAQQMRDIVEKAGECYHDFHIPEDYHCLFVCSKCGMEIEKTPIPRPSPTDLNELFRLARKLGFRFGINTDYDGQGSYLVEDLVNMTERQHLYDLDDALRNALWQAIQEVEK